MGRAPPADRGRVGDAQRSRRVLPFHPDIRRRTAPHAPAGVAYRTLSSIVDITTNHEEQILRILRYLEPDAADVSLAEFQPRLGCAQAWVATQMAADQRTRVRSEPDAEMLATLSGNERTMLRLFLDGLDSHWSLEGLTTWVYGVPKLQLGLSLEVQPTPELKAAQRTFFALLYRLLVGRETGPRLPTLLLAIGAEPGPRPGERPGQRLPRGAEPLATPFMRTARDTARGACRMP